MLCYHSFLEVRILLCKYNYKTIFFSAINSFMNLALKIIIFYFFGKKWFFKHFFPFLYKKASHFYLWLWSGHSCSLLCTMSFMSMSLQIWNNRFNDRALFFKCIIFKTRSSVGYHSNIITKHFFLKYVYFDTLYMWH